MVFPAVVAIHIKDIVEDHGAKTQHYDLPDVADVQRCVKSIGFEWLPPQAILVAECGDLFTQNVAQKSKLETLVQGICCDHERVVVLEQENLTPLGVSIELKQ